MNRRGFFELIGMSPMVLMLPRKENPSNTYEDTIKRYNLKMIRNRLSRDDRVLMIMKTFEIDMKTANKWDRGFSNIEKAMGADRRLIKGF